MENNIKPSEIGKKSRWSKFSNKRSINGWNKATTKNVARIGNLAAKYTWMSKYESRKFYFWNKFLLILATCLGLLTGTGSILAVSFTDEDNTFDITVPIENEQITINEFNYPLNGFGEQVYIMISSVSMDTNDHKNISIIEAIILLIVGIISVTTSILEWGEKANGLKEASSKYHNLYTEIQGMLSFSVDDRDEGIAYYNKVREVFELIKETSPYVQPYTEKQFKKTFKKKPLAKIEDLIEIQVSPGTPKESLKGSIKKIKVIKKDKPSKVINPSKVTIQESPQVSETDEPKEGEEIDIEALDSIEDTRNPIDKYADDARAYQLCRWMDEQ